MSNLLPDGMPKNVVNVAVSILTSVLTVLLIIPGNQGESVIQIAVEALKGLLL